MRSFLFSASALIGLVSAAPAPVPQDIDFDLAYALPNPTYTTASDATAETVTYNPSTVFSAALSQITATDADTVTLDSTAALNRRAACATQQAGNGPVPTPDSVSAFTALPAFSSAAANAPVPSGYTQTFSNLNGSNNAYGYMGYTNLKTYDSNVCATKCNAINGCISFNIYFERDPSVEPGAGCENPPSTTNIKCVFWGGPVSASNANNYGQWRSNFQVVIAGSNGYVNNSVAAVPGYGAATPLGNAAINAPYDKYGFNSYMGDAIFVGAFDANLCAKACSQKSAYNLAHPPTDGSPVQTCQFFNTYILYINKTSNVQGQYCAMYSESWPSSYATNVGQYRGNDHFMIQYSFSYSNTSNAGSAQPLPAVYQAKRDILWPDNSAAPYCSSLLGYTTPLSTTTASVTAISTTASTVTTTVSTITLPLATSTASVTALSSATSTYTTTVTTITTTVAAVNAPSKRQASTISQPSVLSKYPANLVSSACQLAVTSPSITSTISATTTIDTTISTSLSTLSQTETDTSTVLETTTVATTTSTSLTTLALTSTVTTTSAAPIQTFSLNTSNDRRLANSTGFIFVTQAVNGGQHYLGARGLNQDPTLTAVFSIDSQTGHVTVVSAKNSGDAPGNLLYYQPSYNGQAFTNSYVTAQSVSSAQTNYQIPAVCAIDPSSSQFTCQYTAGKTAIIYDCNGSLILYDPSVTPTNYYQTVCSNPTFYATRIS